MRTIIIIFFSTLFMGHSVFAQQQIPVKYLDSLEYLTSKDLAVYRTEYLMEVSLYKANTFYIKSGKLYSVAYFKDTSFKNRVGVYKKYYESGQLQDSSFYNKDGKMISSKYNYPDGKVWVNYRYNPETEESTTEAFDVDGTVIKNFIYFREAEYPGGDARWIEFLSSKINPNVPVKRHASAGKYLSMVDFKVGFNGEVSDIKPFTNLGFGIEEEVMRVIRKSPRWRPAIWLNKPIAAYRRQPLTFLVNAQ